MDYDAPTQPQKGKSFNLSLGPNSSPPIKRGRGSLAIALVVAFIFLLAALGVAGWLVFQKINTPTAETPQDTSATKEVKRIDWVAPDVPAAYIRRDENTSLITRTYYFDPASSCGITTTVRSVEGIGVSTAKEATVATVNAEASGITIATNTDGGDYTVQGSDGKEYTLQSFDLIQNVAIDGVAYTKQNNLVVYKQFGMHLAILEAFCKSDSWTAKKPELEALIKTFTVRVEH